MSNKIILKKSSVADKAPTTGDLEYGELAINYADKRLYFKNSNNSISYFTTESTGTVTSIDVSGGNTGLSFSGGPITSNGTLTLSGTLAANSGGTGQSTYAQGDLLYASAANTLGKLGIGSNNQVLTVSNGTLSWANATVTTSSGAAGQIQISGGSGTFASNSEFSYSTTNRTLTLGDGGTPVSNNSYWTGQTYTISGSIADTEHNGDKIILSGGAGGLGPDFGYGGPLVLAGGTSYVSAKSGNVIIQTDGTDRVIIDNSGNFIQNANTALAKNTIVGVTSQRTLLAKADAGLANNVPITAWNNATANDNVLIEFGTEDTYTTRGNITYNRTAGQVSYNTTSDYRVKVVVGPVTNSGQVIDNLKVYTGMMLDAEIIRPMMVAHEAQEWVPYAVSGEKDAVDENGNPILQQMDHSILVPLLIAEIQSLRQRIQQLEDGNK